MIYEKFKNLTTDRTIKAVIGMSRKNFDLLVPHFSVSYQEIQEKRYKNKEINNVSLLEVDQGLFPVPKNNCSSFYSISKPIRPSMSLGFILD